MNNERQIKELMNKFEAMQRFLVVAQTGSFTKSAEQLGLPKSAVSQSVQLLEKSLGTRLFQRSTRRVTLTDDGEQFLPKCRAILHDLDLLESQFQQGGDEIKGSIKVDMPGRFLCNFVLPHLEQWRQTYPNVTLKLSSNDYQVDLIKQQVDFVVRVGELNDSALICRKLTQFSMLNCVSPSYIKKYGMPQKLEDLQHHLLIDYNATLGSRLATFDYQDQHGNPQQVAMASSVSVNTTEAYLTACEAGLGIIQVPKISIDKAILAGELVSVLDDYVYQSMPVSMLYPSRRQVPKRVQLFMDWLDALVIKEG